MTRTKSRIPLLLLVLVSGYMVMVLPVGIALGQPFILSAVNTDISRLSYGSVSLADLNADGRYDVLFTGNPESSTPYLPKSGIAFNASETRGDDRHLAFDLVPIDQEAWLGKASWIDFNLDGQLDFLLTGTQSENSPYLSFSKLYQGGNGYSPVNMGIVGVHASVIQWADYDNDGDSDLLLMGRTSEHDHTVRLYRNEKGASFIDVATPFPQLAMGDAAWGDYDNDGDFDLALSGVEQSGEFRTVLYRNLGNGEFTDTGAVFPSLAFSALAWADYDSDGDLDLAISGAELGTLETFSGRTKLFRNESGRFVDTGQPFTGVYYGDLTWADYDLDGDLDFFVMGRTAMSGNHIGLIYRNDPGSFELVTGLAGTSTSNAEWGDFDGDRDADLFVSGINLQGIPFTKYYRNDSRLVNAAPFEPVALSAIVDGADVELSWNITTPADDASLSLTYSVRVGTSPGSSDVMSAYASAESGFRVVPGFGNVQTNKSWRLRGLAQGVYYWSVQAIDNSLMGSAFAPEEQFTILTGGKITTEAETDNVLPGRFFLRPIYPNPFQGRSTIEFDIPALTRARLAVYDVLGKELNVLMDGIVARGPHRMDWDGKTSAGRDLLSGVYFVRLTAGGTSQTRQIVVVR